MPIQTPQWTDFLICPICCNEYDFLHNPISLGCGHTLCKPCLSKLQRKQCPYDQTNITIDINDLPINYALLQLVSANGVNASEKSQTQLNLQNRLNLSADHFHHYVKALNHVEDIALYLKPFSSGLSSSGNVNVLSRPMQRKLVMLINCQFLEEEGRIRALKAARSLGERTVTELIIQHQNPQQLSTNLWAAVRARGCQFLGPAMQEEVLKLVLLALEDGSALSRKVLVMFVVQRLEPHFPQASKTSIGHVVQLLYRASCFVVCCTLQLRLLKIEDLLTKPVSKREGDSSLMKLKEEFRTYDALRREHDAQIVEIATEAGLRIAPDQWSALLYGDTAHKSHMQSIIDKLQNPQSFAQSVQELVIALQRTSDPGNLCLLRPHLEYLANIDLNGDFGGGIWQAVSTALEAALIVVSGLVNFIKTHGCRKTSMDAGTNIAVHASKYKISLCRDLAMKGTCPRGISCTFAHSEEELVKYRSKHRKFQRKGSDSAPPLLKLSNNNNVSMNNNNHIMPQDNINLDARGTPNLDDCCYVVGGEVFSDRPDCCFCKVQDFPKFGSQQIFMQPDHFLNNSSFCQNASPMSDSARKITSSQYLVAMNYRKQQIISELQQVLSKVQNQYSAQSYDQRQSAAAFIPNDHLVNSPYILSAADNFRPTLNLANSQNDAVYSTNVPTHKLNLCYNNAVIPGSNLVDMPLLGTTFDKASSLVNAAPKESFVPADFVDWNTNYSKLCHNCNTSETSPLPGPKVQQPVSVCNLTDEVPESLLLESFKLQDKLRGLKKQITNIKDKTYEEGIINNLRALELRLECELAEEEEKSWPLQNKEQT